MVDLYPVDIKDIRIQGFENEDLSQHILDMNILVLFNFLVAPNHVAPGTNAVK